MSYTLDSCGIPEERNNYVSCPNQRKITSSHYNNSSIEYGKLGTSLGLFKYAWDILARETANREVDSPQNNQHEVENCLHQEERRHQEMPEREAKKLRSKTSSRIKVYILQRCNFYQWHLSILYIYI